MNYQKGGDYMFKSIKARVMVIAGLLAISFALVTTVTLANSGKALGHAECKPGWAWGADEKCHTMPPGGPSVHPVK